MALEARTRAGCVAAARSGGRAGVRSSSDSRAHNARGFAGLSWISRAASSEAETEAEVTATTTTEATPPRESIPDWLRSALEKGGQDPDELERTLGKAKVESDSMSLGMGILLRDMKRGLPLAAREAAKESLPFFDPPPLSASEAKQAERAREDFPSFFWFSFIFMNTIP